MERPTLSVAEERCKEEVLGQREPEVAQRVSPRGAGGAGRARASPLGSAPPPTPGSLAAGPGRAGPVRGPAPPPPAGAAGGAGGPRPRPQRKNVWKTVWPTSPCQETCNFWSPELFVFIPFLHMVCEEGLEKRRDQKLKVHKKRMYYLRRKHFIEPDVSLLEIQAAIIT
ncbi:uncharacterized protein LOC110483230 [Lonchura striata]